MHLFGSLGSLMFLIGVLCVGYLLGEKWYYICQNTKARLVSEQPLFFIALTCTILGTQLFLAGFLAELSARNLSDRNQYNIKETIGIH